jgi:hypothetical protein
MIKIYFIRKSDFGGRRNSQCIENVETLPALLNPAKVHLDATIHVKARGFYQIGFLHANVLGTVNEDSRCLS